MCIRRILLLVCVVSLAVGPAAARSSDAPRLTIMTFQSTERGLGAKAAETLRNRLSHDFSEKQLYTLSTDIVQRALKASSFPPSEPLDSSNEKLLAQMVHAEYYITGTITHTTSGYQLLPRLVLSRDPAFTQPLPTSSGPTVDAINVLVSQALREAIKQLNSEQQCVAAMRNGNPQGAITAAQAGIAAYPQATLVRLCELDVYWGTLYPKATTHTDSMRYADSALAVAQAIVAIDPINVQPLRAEAELYAVTGDSVRAEQALLGLARTDPHNTTLTNQVINSLVAMRDTADAVQLGQKVLGENPTDPQTLQTSFYVYLHAQRWQSATAIGSRLIKVDTAAADSIYFIRMAAAYQAMHEPQQAVAVLNQGTVKFPNNADLWELYSQNLRQTGQVSEANVALKRAVALNPKMGVGLLQLADVYLTNHQPDSAYAMLQEASTATSVDLSMIAQTALAQGGQLYQNATGPASRADYQQALRFLQLSNQLMPSTTAQFLVSAAAFAIMQSAAQEANDTKSCTLARLAQHTEDDVPAGLTIGVHDPKYQASATQMMQVLPQLRSAIEGEVKKFCR
jgi:predicted Zn-dependent protease